MNLRGIERDREGVEFKFETESMRMKISWNVVINIDGIQIFKSNHNDFEMILSYQNNSMDSFH